MEKAELKLLIKQAQKKLRYDTPLEAGDGLYVPLDDLRGHYSKNKLFFELGIMDEEDEEDALDPDRDRVFMLFGGHRGCGKSTTLRRYAEELHRPSRYHVLFIDVLTELDVHNMRYSDILLVQAKKLVERLAEIDIAMPKAALEPLQIWFQQRVQTFLEHRSLDIGVTTGATAKTGIPFLCHLFAKMSASVKTGTTYREEIRVIVQDTFGDFAQAFNTLLKQAEHQLQLAQQGARVLFVVDGADRLRSEDAQRFFIDDVHQLQQIHGNFIYCAPIVLLSEQGSAAHSFQTHRLPMIKMAEKGQTANDDDAVMQRLRQLVDKRMDLRLFQDDSALNYLLCASGGHIRDLIRLLNYSMAEAGLKRIDLNTAKAAVRVLATEYSRFVMQETQNDYQLLVQIDTQDTSYTPQSEQTRRLLYDLILLEYNSFWWQTHPAVRTLPAYQKALRDNATGT